MKYKKIMMLTVIALCLFAVSAVSAADNATGDIVSLEDSNQAIEESNNEEIIAATDDGTFTALQKKINNAAAGSTITLENDYKYDEGFSTDGILVTKDLTINGNGYTINGLSKSRIFSLSYENVKYGSSDNFKLTVYNVNFLNGYATGSGGAIKSVAGVVYGSNLLKSYWYSWDLDISNCVFRNNKATGSDGTGGAIDTRGKLTLKGSTFTNNEAKSSGGAVYSGTSKNYGNVECSNCIFTNNKVTGSGGGGALHIYGTAVLNGCSFNGNEAPSYSGGAVYTSKPININTCSFTGNKAKDGGAVFTFSSTVNINDCTFKSNIASRNGGAVYSIQGQNIKNCEFVANQASADGGAVHFNGKSTTTSSSSQSTSIYTNMIESSNFKDNVAGDAGGAIYCVLNKMNGKTYGGFAEKCTFKNNKAKSNDNVYGTTTTNCVFQSSDASAKNTKIPTKLIASKKTFKKSVKAKKYSVTLTTNKNIVISNVWVSLKVNKKTFKAKTNSKGKATFKITNLKKKGTFKAAIKYKGNNKYNKVTKKVKIVVK
ncbi:hypothetical protein [Methanobrevibacter sp.]|uniref:hypothetical protein n=1 Tax=Methanobrevibacter sp. TaxID=66852 RepID=UPI00386B77BF